MKLARDARGCRTYQGGIRVQRSDHPGNIVDFRIDLARIYFGVTL